MNPTPSIGRIVHFVLNSGPCAGCHRPAVIVNVANPYTVNLQVFTDGNRSNGDMQPNMFWKRGCIQDEGGKSRGTWHWPEREETPLPVLRDEMRELAPGDAAPLPPIK